MQKNKFHTKLYITIWFLWLCHHDYSWFMYNMISFGLYHAVEKKSYYIAINVCGRNKANLRNLIAATGLVILLKLDTNRQFFSPCDLEILWMTPNQSYSCLVAAKNNRALLLCYSQLCASFRSHWWIQTSWVTVRKRPIWVKIDDL